MGLLNVSGPARPVRRLSEMTCAGDGLAHLVSEESVDYGLAAGRGLYTALCQHAVRVGSLASLPGRPCQSCHAAA